MGKVRPRTRFEVFKRDDFTCQYCGSRVPNVVLEVDHIIPQCEGGLDIIDNLITACLDCNRGKGGKLLVRTPDTAPNIDDVEERSEQLKAYFEYQREVEACLDDQLQLALTHWMSLPLGNWSVNRSALRNYLRRFGYSKVLAAMDITSAQYDPRKGFPFRYLCGIFKHWAAGD